MEKFIVSLPQWLGVTICSLIVAFIFAVAIGLIGLFICIVAKTPILILLLPFGALCVAGGVNLYKELEGLN